MTDFAVAEPPLDDERHAAARRRRPARPWLALLLTVLPFAGAYLALAAATPLPMNFIPDETFYGHLARSIAHGGGFSWRGRPEPLRSDLYVYVLVPAWALANGVTAYVIAKVITTLLALLIAVPVFLAARAVLPRRLELPAVALVLAGTWMVGGELMTESIALPMATASLCCTFLALQRGRRRLLWPALLFALVAAWARTQVLVLVPILVVVLAVDVARSGRERRARWELHRAPLLLAGALTCAAAMVTTVFGAQTLFGTYASLVSKRPGLAAVVGGAGRELLELGASCGVLPLALLVVLAGRRRAWADNVLGPFLAVLVPTVVLLALENGYYIATVEGLWSIQRYMTYAAPLLLVFTLAAAARTHIVGVGTYAFAGLVSVAALLLPDVQVRGEQPGAFAIGAWGHAIDAGLSDGNAAAALGVLLAAMGVVSAWRWQRRATVPTAPLLTALLFVVLLGQSVTANVWRLQVRDGERSLMPRDLAWVDHHASGPVAAFVVSSVGFEWMALDFFNRSITQVYAAQDQLHGGNFAGGLCLWRPAPQGMVDVGCRLRTTTLLLEDPMAHITFYDEMSSVEEPHVGRLVRVRPPLLLKAIVRPPCPRQPPVIEPVTDRMLRTVPVSCDPRLTGIFWLRRPGTLEVGIRGAPAAEHVAGVGERRYLIPPNRVKTLRLPIPAGDGRQVEIDMDWAESGPADPAVVRVDLLQDGQRQSLL